MGRRIQHLQEEGEQDEDVEEGGSHRSHSLRRLSNRKTVGQVRVSGSCLNLFVFFQSLLSDSVDSTMEALVEVVGASTTGTDGGKLMDLCAETTTTATGSTEASTVRITNWTSNRA